MLAELFPYNIPEDSSDHYSDSCIRPSMELVLNAAISGLPAGTAV